MVVISEFTYNPYTRLYVGDVDGKSEVSAPTKRELFQEFYAWFQKNTGPSKIIAPTHLTSVSIQE